MSAKVLFHRVNLSKQFKNVEKIVTLCMGAYRGSECSLRMGTQRFYTTNFIKIALAVFEISKIVLLFILKIKKKVLCSQYEFLTFERLDFAILLFHLVFAPDQNTSQKKHFYLIIYLLPKSIQLLSNAFLFSLST